MKKDIYAIRNTVDNKIYIGQTKNAADRWSKHIYEAIHGRDNMLIHQAMRQYGYDKFYYQIIEQVDEEDADAREKFWIKHMKTIYPNGYNTCVGGIHSLGIGADHPSANLDQDTLNLLINDLMYSGLSNAKLAKKYGCGEWTVWAVNNGQAYYDARLKYPLKKSNRYDKEKINQVKYALKYELDKSILDIATEFAIDASQVNEINQGRIHAFSNETYPLRSGKNKNVIPTETIDAIVNDLLYTDIPQKDIAARYNVSANCVSGINSGRNYFNNNLSYPLRATYQGGRASSKKTITLYDVQEIENLLMNSNESMRSIAAKYEIGLPTVQNINNGSIIKYRDINKKYPLRDKRYPLIH